MWDHTSHLRATTHNAHCARTCDLLPPLALNPFLQRQWRAASQTSGAFHRSMCASLPKDE